MSEFEEFVEDWEEVRDGVEEINELFEEITEISENIADTVEQRDPEPPSLEDEYNSPNEITVEELDSRFREIDLEGSIDNTVSDYVEQHSERVKNLVDEDADPEIVFETAVKVNEVLTRYFESETRSLGRKISNLGSTKLELLTDIGKKQHELPEDERTERFVDPESGSFNMEHHSVLGNIPEEGGSFDGISYPIDEVEHNVVSAYRTLLNNLERMGWHMNEGNHDNYDEIAERSYRDFIKLAENLEEAIEYARERGYEFDREATSQIRNIAKCRKKLED